MPGRVKEPSRPTRSGSGDAGATRSCLKSFIYNHPSLHAPLFGLNIRSANSLPQSSTTPFDTLRRSPKTIASCYTHICTTVRSRPAPAPGSLLGCRTRRCKRTRRIQTGGSGRPHPLCPPSSVTELSRHGARHIGRLGDADLDSSGQFASRNRKAPLTRGVDIRVDVHNVDEEGAAGLLEMGREARGCAWPWESHAPVSATST